MRLTTGFFSKLGVKVRRHKDNIFHVVYLGRVFVAWSVESMKRQVRALCGIGDLEPLPLLLTPHLRVPNGKRSKYVPTRYCYGTPYWYKRKNRWVESAVRLAA